MPECVEVELTRRYLERALRGAKLRAVEIRDPRLGVPSLFAGYSGLLRAIERKGKALCFLVAPDFSFTVRLGMSGSLVLAGRNSVNGDGRLALDFGNQWVVLIDPRRFGTIRKGRDLPLGWDALGAISLKRVPEPFIEVLAGSVGLVKIVLMDQRKIAGLGNIYANEILFKAGLRPSRRADALSKTEVEKLWGAARRVLATALRHGGISIRNYTHPDGKKGGFQKKFNVYGKYRGEPCPVCGHQVRASLVGQRSTFFCPICQR